LDQEDKKGRTYSYSHRSRLVPIMIYVVRFVNLKVL